ncbi:hypothetical protein C8F04DRAFT_1250260 [Mycena alexandri]|uniref:Uncharacterized protein n=1 Tax=Mycena alexandri TaxID=1745969 RepID=A0AAD6TFC1_9AGAR|nr:hypothetical protein C8F04DRAFT_1250260 [Mycena alexandri]
MTCCVPRPRDDIEFREEFNNSVLSTSLPRPRTAATVGHVSRSSLWACIDRLVLGGGVRMGVRVSSLRNEWSVVRAPGGAKSVGDRPYARARAQAHRNPFPRRPCGRMILSTRMAAATATSKVFMNFVSFQPDHPTPPSAMAPSLLTCAVTENADTISDGVCTIYTDPNTATTIAVLGAMELVPLVSCTPAIPLRFFSLL